LQTFLPGTAQATYEQESTATRAIAAVSRAARHEVSVQGTSHSFVGGSTASTIVVAPVAPGKEPNPQVEPLPPLLSGSQSPVGDIECVRGEASQDDAYPIDPQCVAEFFRGATASGTRATIGDASKAWRQQSATIPTLPDGAIPARVAYEEQCGALCKHATTTRERQFHTALRRAWRDIIAATGRPSKAPLADLVFAVELHAAIDSASPADSVVFCSVASAASRHGRFEATQMFALLHVVGDAAKALYGRHISAAYSQHCPRHNFAVQKPKSLRVRGIPLHTPRTALQPLRTLAFFARVAQPSVAKPDAGRFLEDQACHCHSVHVGLGRQACGLFEHAMFAPVHAGAPSDGRGQRGRVVGDGGLTAAWCILGCPQHIAVVPFRQ
jgi:hypothetical protein